MSPINMEHIANQYGAYRQPTRGDHPHKNNYFIQKPPAFLTLPCNMTNERKEKLLRVLANRQNDLAIVLENVFDPHNISAVMRTADSVGIQDIYILNTRIAPHKKWGAKSSSSAADWLTIHQFTDTEACFNQLRNKNFTILTTHLDNNSVNLYQLDLTKKLALVFGNEREGVSPEIRALADGNFIIPQAGIIQSLNISVACAVTLYEACRQKTVSGHYGQPKITGDDAKQLLLHWGMNESDLPHDL
jgi:tRNA (guanosine-2'-O-)-methyltransferase